MKLFVLAITTALFSGPIFAAPLTLQTHNPQEKGIFAANPTPVSGLYEVMPFDAQLSVENGERLVDMIKKNGKPLVRIVITSGDPDFYFSLEPLMKAFPQAEVVAMLEVVRHVETTKATKLAYWGLQMKDGAPTQVYVSQALKANSFTIDGEKVVIMQSYDYTVFVWIWANKTILGGTGVAWSMHLWTVDIQTSASRQQWRHMPDQMIALHPQRATPGHYLDTPSEGNSTVRLIKTHLQQFEQALKTHQNSAGAIEAAETQQPGLAETNSLESSARVNTGGMKR